ncbi:hypothetical protein E1269_12115 [Jiangella asiatica]|uniref:Uncharacterized protein n=1 Tax=Jiangella asiatica TaxID=2530372 RepID=A0A4V2Z2W6_9ACTN|nr:hypothetical protein E1269_12115 [Jiangella asiatica]
MVITQIAQDVGALTAGMASALVGAGVLSVLVFPTIALRLQDQEVSGMCAGGVSRRLGARARTPEPPDPRPGR